MLRADFLRIPPLSRPDSTAPRQHRAPIDRGTADRVHQKRRSIENYMVWSYPQGKAVINRVFHRGEKAQKSTEKHRVHKNAQNEPDPKIDFFSVQ